MNCCPTCHSHIDPKFDVRTLLTVIAITVLITFVGTILFYDWKIVPKFEQRIEKDGEIKKELQKNYVPQRPEPKKKG